MWRYFTSLLASLILVSCSHSNSIDMLKNSQVEIIHSQYIGDYKITTYWPNNPPPKDGWPVIYLLDGNSFFLTATNIISEQSCARCALQDGVIVAIDYANSSRRALDYLPNPQEMKLEILANGNVNIPEAYGGADKFFAFIEDELKPRIEANFSINKNKQTLFGHSYGGLFTLHALLTYPATFNTYIASSPSIWFSGQYIFSELDSFIAKYANSQLPQATNVLISVGGYEQSLTPTDMQLPSIRQQELRQHKDNRRMIDGSKQFVQSLNAENISNLIINYTIYPKQTHQTVGIIALLDGMQISFKR